jgi:amino acid transporter
MARLAFLALFALATFTLSRVIASFNDLSAAGISDQTFGPLLLWLVALLALLFVLGLYVYAGERKNGRVRRRVAVYERILGPDKEGSVD